jgi:tripartite-type tricarboxylate transporter receptor subunit TctC
VKLFRKLLILVAMLSVSLHATAQSAYPSKPITLLVGFPPGGSGDFVARVVGQKLSGALGQPVVVNNRGGANGVVAATATAAAPADGYTLYVTSMGLATNPHLYAGSKLDPVKDFTAISLLATVPNVLVTHPTVPAKNLRELLAHARARNKPLTLATTGQGAPGHLASELLQRAENVKFEHIPYKGSGPALADIMAGHVDMSFPTVVAALPGLQSGKLRALAVTGKKRSALLADVPTLSEAGIQDRGAGSGWYGLVAPAGVPNDIADRLGDEAVNIMKMPDVRERFTNNGADTVGSTRAQMAVFLAQEHKLWGELIKAANIKPENQ